MRTLFYILYIWLPVLVGIGSIIGSGLISWRLRGVIHVFLSLIVAVLVVGALLALYRIFYLHEHQVEVIYIFGSEHLNFIPYFAIFGAFIIFATQGFYVLRDRTDAD